MMFGSNPLAPTLLEWIIPFGLPVALICVLLYSILRFAVWTPRGGPRLDQVRKHAYWTGLIAWMFSSLAAAGTTGVYYYGQASGQDNPWAFIPWFALLLPVAAVIGVHALGQATWPAPKSATRVATLEFRRIRDYVQPGLGWTVLGSFVFTAAVIPFVAVSSGFRAVATPPPGTLSAWTMGKVDGWVVAVALSLPLLLLVAGSLLVMRLIASRRSLENLSSEQNKTLRLIGMNRLLRVCATVATGLAAIAGNYLSQPKPGSDIMSYTNWPALINMAVLVTMFFWKPPALEPATASFETAHSSGARPSKESLGSTKLMDSTTVILIPAAAAGVLLGYALRHVFGVMGIVTMAMIAIVLAYWALELLLARNYGAPRMAARRKRSPLPAPLPTYLYVGLGLSALGLMAAVIYAAQSSMPVANPRWDASPAPSAIYVVPGSLAVTILLVGLPAAWFVLSRPALGNVSPSLDATLRRRSLSRITRTVSSGWLALAGFSLFMSAPVPSGNPLEPQFDPSILGALSLALAAITLFLPVKSYAPEDLAPLPPAAAMNR